MTARVLVVDDIPANVKLLQARLSQEYFDVRGATSGAEALRICDEEQCDIVLLDVMMPEMDGFEVCKRLKANPRTHHIPVVMVTALDQPSDRVKGLESGADDFLTKPVSDIALITRVKSLVRLKMLTDELRMRAETSRDLGIEDPFAEAAKVSGENGRILIVDDRLSSYDRFKRILSRNNSIQIETQPQEALFRAADENYDLIIVSLALENFDGLRLCSQLRSLERTRNVPVLIVVDPDDNARLMRGLDLGVNDYITRPVDPNELVARVVTQIKRRRYAERLRDNVQMSVTMAVTDSLTGLHNRRYMESHLQTLVEKAQEKRRPLSLLVLDIDHFKAVNDTYGHDAGDEVLKEFARRVRKAVRGLDLACRMGGEEFVIVMPETDIGVAVRVGERIRATVAGDPFPINGGTRAIDVTVSIGASTLAAGSDTAELLMKRADEALYNAKHTGRNRVSAQAA
ncbi:MAG: PleD family two-component system response regulator [Rhodobiaceae bacterium]|nr:PleD family two-component system response regulator [Rhodobiaceae bacterium]MCC0048782.1 PleD family two-component system response regulator [Rhodobiaceae bacterium]